MSESGASGHPATVIVTRPVLERMTRDVERAYPEEGCGLLIGRGGETGAALVVSAVEPARNVAGDRRADRFEVDPQARFDLMRRLGAAGGGASGGIRGGAGGGSGGAAADEGAEERSGGGERIVGHYHSHPDHPAIPSARDREMAFEPELVWLIISVMNGHAVDTTAHMIDPASGQFRALGLHIAEG